MTIFLHIGLGKTGSTSVQAFLEANAAVLRTQGYIVPTSAGRRNHRRFTLYAHDDHVIDNLRRAKGYTTPEKVLTFRKRFNREFLEEAQSWLPTETLLVSSEQLSQLRSNSALVRLRELLDRTGHSTKVIMYVRRQDAMLVSEYSQFIKGGKVETLEEIMAITPGRKTYNYYATATNWGNVFGKENIIVRPFERSQLVDGDTVKDYLKVVGIEDTSEFEFPREENRSLDIYVMEYLRLMNKYIPRWANVGRNTDRDGLADALESISDGPKLRLSSEMAKAFMVHFDGINAKVAKEFLGREDGRLFIDDFGDTEGTTLSNLTPEKSAEIGARLWLAMKKGA